MKIGKVIEGSIPSSTIMDVKNITSIHIQNDYIVVNPVLKPDDTMYKFYKVDMVNGKNQPDHLAIKKDRYFAIVGEYTSYIDDYIQTKIDLYNKKNGIVLDDIESCLKYKIDPTSMHHDFCSKVLDWVTNKDGVWETVRAIQLQYIRGEITEPTFEEVIEKLPEFNYDYGKGIFDE